jgi:cathepsin L
MKAFSAIALAALVSATPMGEHEHEFIKFVARNNRRYATKEEYLARYEQFERNHKFMIAFNKLGEHKVAHNHMSDWTVEEYRQLLGYKPSMKMQATEFENYANVSVPESVDWRSEGAVTGVKDQGQCGSCWTFSSTGSLEGRHFQKSGVLTSFSEQQLVDCCNNGVGQCYNSQGCQGGVMDEALTYSQQFDLMTEDDYPYTAENGSCAYQGAGSGAGYNNVSKTDIEPNQDAFKASLAQGPTSIAIEADQQAFQMYSSGILSSGCGEELDHGVLAVGYGVEDGVTYTIVKNSWADTWGDQGYVKLNQDNNACGHLNQPVRPQ